MCPEGKCSIGCAIAEVGAAGLGQIRCVLSKDLDRGGTPTFHSHREQYDNGMQDEADYAPHQRAVVADVLQIPPHTEF